LNVVKWWIGLITVYLVTGEGLRTIQLEVELEEWLVGLIFIVKIYK
jgi:hypothetical protein